MAQELVLLTKSKYENLISKAKNNESFCENVPQQTGGKLDSTENNKEDIRSSGGGGGVCSGSGFGGVCSGSG